MNTNELHDLLDGCLRYMKAMALPRPLPENPADYSIWRRSALHRPSVDQEAESSWFELDRLVAGEPVTGWQLLKEVAARCMSEDEWSQLAAGPLSVFLTYHGETYTSEIEEELTRNEGLRHAYQWLQS